MIGNMTRPKYDTRERSNKTASVKDRVAAMQERLVSMPFSNSAGKEAEHDRDMACLQRVRASIKRKIAFGNKTPTTLGVYRWVHTMLRHISGRPWSVLTEKQRASIAKMLGVDVLPAPNTSNVVATPLPLKPPRKIRPPDDDEA